MKKLLHLVIGCLVPLFFVEGEMHSQDIEGLEIWSNVTKAKIIEKFGPPDDYEIQCWAPGDGMNEKGEIFRYDIDAANPSKEGLIIDLRDDALGRFVITDSKYRAFTNNIQGGVRVGDSFSVMDGFFTPDEIENSDGGTWYMGFSERWNHINIFVKEGRICTIACMAGE